MSIIPRLLAGEATEAIDLNAVRAFLGNSKKAGKQVQKFARSARRSDIGGDAGFEQMSAAQQREFISSSNTHVARKIRGNEAVTSYRSPGRVPEPTTIPRLLLGDRAGGAVDGIINTTRAAAKEVSDIPRLGAMAGEGLVESVMQGAAGLGRFASHAGETVKGAAGATEGLGRRMDDAFINTVTAGIDATASLIKGGAKGTNIMYQAVRGAAEGAAGGIGRFASHVGETAGGTASGLPYALKETGSDFLDLISPVTRGLAGDTSGRAASTASAVFQRNYEDVFSSQATAEAFGVNQNVLKQAFSQSGDDFTATLRGGGLGDDAIEGLEAFRSEVRKVADEGGNLSSEGMQAMLKNQAEVGNMYGGFSRAGATASPNALLRGMAGEGTGMESIMGIAAVAGLAGGANVMMGGEFTEGAAVGGIGALSVRGIAKGVAGSMGDIENAMMKSILGDDMVTTGSSATVIKKGTVLTDIVEDHGNLKMSDLGLRQGAKKEMTLNDYYTTPNTRVDLKTTRDYASAPVTGSQARRENLNAIQALGDDAEQLQGFGKKQMRKLLNPNKEKNVAMNNRALVLGGGMLSGVAFTGTADRRDYRRGFNAHRGNRI